MMTGARGTVTPFAIEAQFSRSQVGVSCAKPLPLWVISRCMASRAITALFCASPPAVAVRLRSSESAKDLHHDDDGQQADHHAYHDFDQAEAGLAGGGIDGFLIFTMISLTGSWRWPRTDEVGPRQARWERSIEALRNMPAGSMAVPGVGRGKAGAAPGAGQDYDDPGSQRCHWRPRPGDCELVAHVAVVRSLTHISAMISLASTAASERYLASVDCLIDVACRPTSARMPIEKISIATSSSRVSCRIAGGEICAGIHSTPPGIDGGGPRRIAHANLAASRDRHAQAAHRPARSTGAAGRIGDFRWLRQHWPDQCR